MSNLELGSLYDTSPLEGNCMAWSNRNEEWSYSDPTFESSSHDPERMTGPWVGHRWFVYDLLTFRKPGLIVELGTHYGTSFFAMCQAAKDNGDQYQLVAIDTWKGDPHAGFYGDEVWECVQAVDESCYGQINRKYLKATFQDALSQFSDNSIDLLHIDGFHSYDAVKGDFERWLPKVAVNGVVILHDAAADTGYGSAEFCRELLETYPGFLFTHSYGLAVVFPNGTEGWEQLLSDSIADRNSLYYRARFEAYLFGIQLETHIEMVEGRDHILAAQDVMIADRDQTIEALERRALAEQENVIHLDAMLLERESVIREKTIALESMDGALSGLRSAQRDSLIANQQERLDIAAEEIRAKSRLIRAKDARIKKISGISEGRKARIQALDRKSRSARNAVKVLALFVLRRLKSLFSRNHKRPAKPGLDRQKVTADSKNVALPSKNTTSELPKLDVHILNANFDDEFYRSQVGLPSDADAWSHYLKVGLLEGIPVRAKDVPEESYKRVIVRPEITRPLSSATSYTPEGTITATETPLVFDYGKYKLITFDLWDTLIERVRPADSAKFSTARELKRRFNKYPGIRQKSVSELTKERVSIEFELASGRESQEYNVVEVLAVQLSRHCPDLGISTEAQNLAEFELRDEIKYLAARTDIVGEPPANAAIISDFYFDSQALREIVASVRPDWKDIPLYSSCEIDLSKRIEGRLLEYVRDQFSVTSSEHLHIGDNLHADVDMQVAQGGTAVFVPKSISIYPPPGRLNSEFPAELLANWPSYCAEKLPGKVSDARFAGRKWAIFPVFLVLSAIETALENSATSVYYLSREGIFLKQVHEAIVAQLPELSQIKPRHLAVSRRSTFGPSLSDFNSAELSRMWSMYASQSIKGLCISVGVEEVPLEVIERYDLDWETKIEDIANDERVEKLLTDEDFVSHVGAFVAEQQVLLRQYLREQFAPESGLLVVCDVGWRGTIQDNIARLVSRKSLGVYLGLFRYYNEQPTNTEKSAVCFDGNKGDYFGFVALPAAIERPWTPDEPSTIAYVRGKDGRVNPVLEVAEEHTSDYVREFQAGVLEAAPILARWIESIGISTTEYQDALYDVIKGYYKEPDPVVADIWFDSDHDDTFGSLGYAHRYAKDRPCQEWLEDGGEQLRDDAFRASGWEPGYSQWRPVRNMNSGLRTHD